MADRREHEGGPSVSIIVPVRDKIKFLAPCLDSVLRAAQEYGNTELIVVDNMSTDGAWELLRDSYGRVARLERSAASTVAAVRNFGAEKAAGEVFCFIDSDCLVPDDYFQAVVRTLRTRNAAAVGHGVRVPESTWIERAWQDMHHMDREGSARWLPGACFSVSADAFQRVGGFKEALVSGEDIDLADRLRMAGLLVWSSPELVILHLDNPTTVGAFLRKEIWRGKGALRMGGPIWRNKVLVMALGYSLSLVAALALLLYGSLPLVTRIAGAIALAVAIPLVTVLYRLERVYRGGGGVRLRALVPGTGLYALYFVGRATALAQSLVGPR